jgi:hypothetical protein
MPAAVSILGLREQGEKMKSRGCRHAAAQSAGAAKMHANSGKSRYNPVWEAAWSRRHSMTGKERIRRAYAVEVRPGPEEQGFSVSYLPRGLQQERGPGGKAKPVPEFHATFQSGGRKAIQWDQRPTDPEAGPEDFDKDARHRVKLLQSWLTLLAGLMSRIRGWATELDWSAKELDKPLADSEIGSYRVPVLLMQKGDYQGAPGAGGSIVAGFGGHRRSLSHARIRRHCEFLLLRQSLDLALHSSRGTTSREHSRSQSHRIKQR